jgi:MFS family permease
MHKPSPLWHMIRWGSVSGTILAMLYMVFILGLGSASLVDLLSVFFQPFLWALSLLFGGVPGAILGFVDGMVLRSLVADAPMPFTRAEMNAVRYKVYAWLGIVTTIGGFVIPWLIFYEAMAYVWFLLFVPPIIAGIAAAYAGHRYLFALRRWSESLYGGQKQKSKNSERLEDKLKNEMLYDEEAEGRHEYESS